MNDEIFGPLMPVISINSVDEAIDIINKKPKPLVVYAFTKNDKLVQRLREQTSSGALSINDCLVHNTIASLRISNPLIIIYYFISLWWSWRKWNG